MKSVTKAVKKIIKKVAPKAAKKAAKKAPKKSPAKKAASKKVVAKKVAPKKTAAKKTAPKKAAAKKVAAKKPVASKKVIAPKKVVAPKKAAAPKLVITPIEASNPITFTGPAAPLMDLILKALDDAKAENTVAINLEGRSAMADGMVVTTGRVDRHVNAIAEQLLSKLRDAGKHNIRVEGKDAGDWCLVDTGDIIVHIFRPEVRAFYNLEKLWSADAPQ